MYRPANYMPLGFATAQEDGTILREPAAPSYSAFPLENVQTTYDGYSRPSPANNPGPSPTSTFASSRRPVADRSSSSSTLLGEENYFSYPSPGTPNTTRSYGKNGDRGGKGLEKEFKNVKQFFHLLATGFLRFLVSAGLIVALYECIWAYSSQPLLNTSQKRMFNFLVTAISLALGLNLASSLKSVAVKSRWWILSWEKRTLEEAEAILSSHSLTEVVKLGIKSSFKKPSLTIGCSLWLLVNVAVQAFVAALGLNWSIVSAIDASSHVAGDVRFSNMTQYYFGDAYDSNSADQITAHLYGEISTSAYVWTTPNSDIPDRSQVVPPLTLYSTNGTDVWDFSTYTQYVFLDAPAANDSSIGRFYSNRSITVEATCDSVSEPITVYPNGTVELRNVILQPNSTAYWTYSAEDGTSLGCGDRCAMVYALENDGQSGYYYTCNVTVGSVTNVTHFNTQQLPDRLARMAGMSIALTGYSYGQPADAAQQQAYTNDFIYGAYLDGNTTNMELFLRSFAISTIVSADYYNPYVQDGIPGMLPEVGVSLTLDHPEFIEAILGGIGGFHFLLFILAAYLANRAIVIDDNYLAIAMLYQPIVERLRGHGSLLKNKQIFKELGNPKVSYGAVLKQSATGMIKHLEISENTERPPKGWHGWYD